MSAESFAVRAARPDEMTRLATIGRAAETLFAAHGIELPPSDAISVLDHAERVLVIGDPALGYAALGRLDGLAHLEEIAVDPRHGRQGHGSRLLAETCRDAAAAGYRALTLTTFRELPFNAPWYARHGFRELPVSACGRELRQRWAHEAGIQVRPRVVMVRELAETATS